MLTDRANAICLLEILKEYSDAEHILQMKDILSKMNTLYGIRPDRRTVYSAITLLMDLGYEISPYEENEIGYYLKKHAFEPSEIRLLTDAVRSFSFLPARHSRELIEKLTNQLSVHKRKQLRHLTVVHDEKKTDNRQVFYNIDVLDEAIAKKKLVQFTYMAHGMDKKLHPRREKPYTANPYAMVYTNEHFYLICSLVSFPKTAMYRIDRMKDIRILETDSEHLDGSENMTADAVYAFAGKPERAVIHCDRYILGDVIDKFGTGIRLADVDENTFSASFTVSPQGVKFWALQYLPYVEVIEPQWLRDEIVESVRSNKYFNCKGE